MGLKRLPNNIWLYRAVLATWVVSAIIVMLLLSKIDTIVNVELYKHGLQFSHDWATPYSTYLSFDYVALAVPIALSLFAIAVGFTPNVKKAAGSLAKRLPKSQPVGFIPRIKKEVENTARRLPRSQPAEFIPKIKKTVENIAERLPRFRLKVSTSKFRSKVLTLKPRLKAFTLKFRPKISTSKFRSKVLTLKPRLKAFTLKFRPKISTSKFRSKVFTSKVKKATENIAEPTPKSQPAASQEQKPQESSDYKSAAPEKANVRGSAGVFCPNCGKTFGRPMVMLDFADGKSKLVNVCPYCNHVLGSAETEESSGIDILIADLDKKLTH
jgi:uncharacterized Zn-finger protein